MTAACMVATAAVQAAEHPLPQMLLVQCPADIRQQVPLPVFRRAIKHQHSQMHVVRSAGWLVHTHVHPKPVRTQLAKFSVTARVGKKRAWLNHMVGQFNGVNHFLSDSDHARRAEQVTPPVPPHAGGQGTGLLMWPQRLAPGDALTAVASGTTAALRREHAARAAVAFLCRLHASATPEQAAALPAPAPVPPFTARGPEPVPDLGMSCEPARDWRTCVSASNARVTPRPPAAPAAGAGACACTAGQALRARMTQFGKIRSTRLAPQAAGAADEASIRQCWRCRSRPPSSG